MAGAKKSKNSRVISGNSNKRQLVGEISLLVSTNGGRNAYVLDVATGKNPNLATDSEEFLAAVKANAADGYGTRIRAEVEKLAGTSPVWAATLARLEAAGAFTVEG